MMRGRPGWEKMRDEGGGRGGMIDENISLIY
jgi:hypothetical protein